MIRKLERRVIGTDYGCGGASFSEVIDKVNEVIDFINSLRSLPKSSGNWKPSEEQMEALDKAIPVCMGVVGRDGVATLESLYEQLKKLM